MKKALSYIVGLIIVGILIGGFWLVTSNTKNPIDQTATSSEPQTEQTPSAETPTEQNDNQDATKTYTKDEVAAHNKESDCWTIISGSVYNITSYIPRHPGGDEILRACGTDATTLFESRTTESGEQVGSGTAHSSSAASQLASLKIGSLAQ